MQTVVSLSLKIYLFIFERWGTHSQFRFTRSRKINSWKRISSDISSGKEENRGEEKEGKKLETRIETDSSLCSSMEQVRIRERIFPFFFFFPPRIVRTP